MAKALGVERIPVSGRQKDKHGADFQDGLVMYQAKQGYDQPGYILGWLRGICTTAEKHNKLGAVVWKKKGKGMEDAVVVIRFEDWVQLHGKPNKVYEWRVPDNFINPMTGKRGG